MYKRQRDKSAVNESQMKKLVEHLKEQFDYILLDCPAGIEQGFKNAIAGADRALVVTTPEVSAIRDADRIIGLLEASGFERIDLVINRMRYEMVRRGDMMSVDDVVDILSIPLIGVVPDLSLIHIFGYDTTEVSILSLGGIVLSRLIKTGGLKFDEAVRQTVRREFNLLIGQKTAATIRQSIGDLEKEGKGAVVYLSLIHIWHVDI